MTGKELVQVAQWLPPLLTLVWGILVLYAWAICKAASSPVPNPFNVSSDG